MANINEHHLVINSKGMPENQDNKGELVGGALVNGNIPNTSGQVASAQPNTRAREKSRATSNATQQATTASASTIRRYSLPPPVPYSPPPFPPPTRPLPPIRVAVRVVEPVPVTMNEDITDIDMYPVVQSATQAVPIPPPFTTLILPPIAPTPALQQQVVADYIRLPHPQTGIQGPIMIHTNIPIQPNFLANTSAESIHSFGERLESLSPNQAMGSVLGMMVGQDHDDIAMLFALVLFNPDFWD